MATFTTKYGLKDTVFYRGNQYAVYTVRFHVSGGIKYDIYDGENGRNAIGVAEEDLSLTTPLAVKEQLVAAIQRAGDDPKLWPLWMRSGLATAQGSPPVKQTALDKAVDDSSN